MPKFFFHIRGIDDFRDNEGTELDDCTAARREAVRYAGAVIADNAANAKPEEHLLLEVTDEGGSVLYSLDFSMRRAAPSVKSQV